MIFAYNRTVQDGFIYAIVTGIVCIIDYLRNKGVTHI